LPLPNTAAKPVSITGDQGIRVSGLLLTPPRAHAGYVLAHGAGAGMNHPFMASVAVELGQRGIATLRYQFPYMERGSKRPDAPRLAHATVRAAVAAAAHAVPELPLIAGGKSFGGRMTSQAQALKPLPGVRGLAFLGFPLHPAGKPSDDRAAHLSAVRIPMLFLQGTRDALADSQVLASVLSRLSPVATSHLIDQADHSFHVPVRSGTTDHQVLNDLLDTLVAWAAKICGSRTSAEP
jgi:uncharacterized protein